MVAFFLKLRIIINGSRFFFTFITILRVLLLLLVFVITACTTHRISKFIFSDKKVEVRKIAFKMTLTKYCSLTTKH